MTSTMPGSRVSPPPQARRDVLQDRLDDVGVVVDAELIGYGEKHRVGLGDRLILRKLLDQHVRFGSVAAAENGALVAAEKANLVQAYIRSQALAGWMLTRGRYDDGGYSGGSTERPGLQQLLADVKAGRIDVIVVYKVDRLTRSLADFAKLVELFDAHGVSFVSVTGACKQCHIRCCLCDAFSRWQP